MERDRLLVSNQQVEAMMKLNWSSLRVLFVCTELFGPLHINKVEIYPFNAVLYTEI